MTESRSPPSEPVEILLVEDNPGDVRLTQEAFEEGKIETRLHTVTDGVEALDYLYQRGDYANTSKPHLILLDLNLPRKNGDEILAEIQDEPELRRIPVIVLTSSKSQEDVIRSYELNVNAYLTKPINPLEFIETVSKLEEFWFSLVRLPTVDS